MNIPLAMLVLYIVLTVGIGAVVAARGKVSSRQFLTAQGNLAWYMIVPLLFAEMMAGAATIGKAATGFTTGISAVWVNWGMSIGMIVFIVVRGAVLPGHAQKIRHFVRAGGIPVHVR